MASTAAGVVDLASDHLIDFQLYFHENIYQYAGMHASVIYLMLIYHFLFHLRANFAALRWGLLNLIATTNLIRKSLQDVTISS